MNTSTDIVESNGLNVVHIKLDILYLTTIMPFMTHLYYLVLVNVLTSVVNLSG